MGFVNAEITLKNATDVGNFECGSLKEQEVRQTTVTAMVDTGSGTLVINEKLRQQLGLRVRGETLATLANEVRATVKVAAPVEVHWKNRSMVCSPLVVSGDSQILLGAIPLENMDLMVDPVRKELVGAHGDEVVSLII